MLYLLTHYATLTLHTMPLILCLPLTLRITQWLLQAQTGEVRLNLANMEVESMLFPQQIAQFDITLAMVEQEDELRGSFQYNTDLFNESTVARLGKHYSVLLDSIASGASLPLSL